MEAMLHAARICELHSAGDAQNGGTVLPIANPMPDSEPGSSPISYSSFIVTIALSYKSNLYVKVKVKINV